MTLKQASEKWGISPRMINYYCSAGRIAGAVKMGTVWLIPKDAKKMMTREENLAIVRKSLKVPFILPMKEGWHMSKTLLIVDDEKDMGAMLKQYFEPKGYNVALAENGVTGIEKAGKQPDLILLDVNMPDVDGIEVCRRIRDLVTCPILFLTARIEDKDKLEGFAAGGDDYIVKPFSVSELGARVAAHLRREDRSGQKAHRLFLDDHFMIDYTAGRVSNAGEIIPLTPKEYEIIELLSTHPGQLFSKERIFEHIWNIDSDACPSTSMEHISRLRAKLAGAGCKPYIQTVWGMGYKWVK